MDMLPSNSTLREAFCGGRKKSWTGKSEAELLGVVHAPTGVDGGPCWDG